MGITSADLTHSLHSERTQHTGDCPTPVTTDSHLSHTLQNKICFYPGIDKHTDF